ncbi:MAG: hypothetical protein H0V76_02950 [Blastocatellia bacterium]|nr:hypothetical protein [Blastocatellia bacterium]
MAEKTTYDKSIGTKERSVTAATKVWALVLGVVFVAGLIILYTMYSAGTTNDALPTGTRPAPGGAAEP